MPIPFLRRHRTPDAADHDELSPTVVDAASRVATWQRLEEDETRHLTALSAALAEGLRFEEAQGFRVTDDVRATIAAHAALLGLKLETDSYREVSSVIVHASTIELEGDHHVGGGIHSDETRYLDGEAHARGPVLLAWDAVVADLAAPWRGRNVVLHEFAHHLDLLDGWVDGTPLLRDQSSRRQWIEVCTAAFERLRHLDSWGVLDPYGATDPGEFFAVAVETFFTRPFELRDAEPDLYGVLGDYLGQDPAARSGGG